MDLLLKKPYLIPIALIGMFLLGFLFVQIGTYGSAWLVNGGKPVSAKDMQIQERSTQDSNKGDYQRQQQDGRP